MRDAISVWRVRYPCGRAGDGEVLIVAATAVEAAQIVTNETGKEPLSITSIGYTWKNVSEGIGSSCAR